MSDYLIQETSREFSLLIIDCYHFLTREKREFIMAKQLLKSGTSVWANITEAQDAQSKKDFLSKISISLKEAKETQYRITLLDESWYLDGYNRKDELIQKTNQMVYVLIRIVKTTKESLQKKLP